MVFWYLSFVLTCFRNPPFNSLRPRYVGKSTIIGSDNGISHGRHQAIIWTNAGILLIEPLGTNFSEILIEIDTFSFKKMHLKMSSAKWRPFCLGLNVLTHWGLETPNYIAELILVVIFVFYITLSHHLNQHWLIFDRPHRNKRKWNMNKDIISLSVNKMYAKWRSFVQPQCMHQPFLFIRISNHEATDFDHTFDTTISCRILVKHMS